MSRVLKRWILFPFMIAANAVLALLVNNIDQVSFVSSIRVLVVALVLAGLFLGLFLVLLKDVYKAGLAASLTSFLFFTYGHLYGLVEDLQIGDLNIGRHRFLAPIVFLFFLAVIWWIVRRKSVHPLVTFHLNMIGLVLLALPLVQLAWFGIKYRGQQQMTEASQPESQAALFQLPANQPAPDIYYIILDSYSRGDVLGSEFGFDNSAFLAALEARGFFVAGCSQSNYSYTASSLSSSLNMQYLDSLSPDFAPPNTDIVTLAPVLQDNAVRRVLDGLGYLFVTMESGFGLTEFSNAPIYLSPRDRTLANLLLGGLNPFEAMFYQATIGDLLYALHIVPSEIQNSLFSYSYQIYRDRILYQFDQLAQIPDIPGPKFVFVHILAPHNPFVFDAEGHLHLRAVPFTMNADVDALRLPDYIRGYTEELVYINQRILQSIDAIFANSTNPLVILLQADHGSSRMPGKQTAILNAYYLPDPAARSMLYPTISPVNSFRLVFNAYFSAAMPLLQDDAYYADLETPFAFSSQPDPNPACSRP